MNGFLRSIRGAAAAAALPILAAGCLGSEATGTVTEVYAKGIVYGVVRLPSGAPAGGVRVESFLYPIDRRQIESGTCLGQLTPGPFTTTAADGTYRLEINGFLGRPGVGCVQLAASPTEAVPAGDATVESQNVKYLLTRQDSSRADITLPPLQ